MMRIVSLLHVVCILDLTLGKKIFRNSCVGLERVRF